MNNTKLNLIKYSLLAIGLLVAGCAGTSETPQKSQNKITDSNIAAIVVGANKIDISAARIALKKSTNPKVREFAQRMVTDHESILNAAVQLVTRLGVKPENNDLVHALAKQSRNHEENLNRLSGRNFDKVYIDHEVDYHIAVIDVVKNQLIPNANNAELKDTLVSVLPGFDAHLAHCKMIQKTL